MQQYLDQLQYILDHGEVRKDRTGTGTISVFGMQTRYDLRDGFPLMTTKKMFIRPIAEELLCQQDWIAADREVLKHDKHWIPNVDGTLGKGITDWKLVAYYLAQAPLDLPPDFEITIGADEDDLEQLHICRIQAQTLYRMILDHKEQCL